MTRRGKAFEALEAPIDVCLCSHGPRLGILVRCLDALARQTAGPGSFRVLLVDNRSTPPLAEELLEPLRAAGVEARMVREERLGLTAARLRAIAETRGPWILFLDDDNELRADFIEEGIRFAAGREDLGCFGGKLLLPDGIKPPRWMKDFIPYLAVKDAGEEVITGCSRDWGRWEPPGAGAWVRRNVADAFLCRYREDPLILELGRRGKTVLASCEDAVMMREAIRFGLQHAYDPRLALFHHLDPARFRAGYLIRLLGAYGASEVLVETLVKGRPEVPRYAKYYRSNWKFGLLVVAQLWRGRKTSAAYALAMVAFHWTARAAFRRFTGNEFAPRAVPAVPLQIAETAGVPRSNR